MKFYLWGLLGLPFFLSYKYELAKQSFVCPQQLKPLIEQMLKDLPSYANRVIQRSRISKNKTAFQTYVLLAGHPDYRPLPLKTRQYQASQSEPTEQVFLTTLERDYNNHGFQESQNYHWLFLTSSGGSWRLVMLYTQLGSTIPKNPPSPPEETSNGIIGQAITLWLRDCQAGTIRTH